jgi:DNA-binding transcriptional ArsR family regulator
MNTQFIDTLPDDWLPTAQIFAAMGDATRQKILLLFEPGEELSIKDIADIFPLSRTAIVHHLMVLERAGVLESRREGKSSLYHLREDLVLEAIDRLRTYILEEFPARAAAREGGMQ